MDVGLVLADLEKSEPAIEPKLACIVLRGLGQRVAVLGDDLARVLFQYGAAGLNVSAEFLEVEFRALRYKNDSDGPIRPAYRIKRPAVEALFKLFAGEVKRRICEQQFNALLSRHWTPGTVLKFSSSPRFRLPMAPITPMPALSSVTWFLIAVDLVAASMSLLCIMFDVLSTICL